MGADNILGNRIASVYLSHAAGSAWSKEISTEGLQANIHELTTECRGIHAEDELYQEKATLERSDRREIVKAIQALESGNPANYVVDVSEIFCPPRLTACASRHGLRGEVAMDLRTGYNFDLEADRREAMEHVNIDKPHLILLSPKCSVRSQLQRLNQRRRDPESLARDVATAGRHEKFCVEVAQMQLAAGRGSMFEHPLGAETWKLPHMQPFMHNHPDVQLVPVDMCAFGLRVPGVTDKEGNPGEDLLIKKSTGILTNVAEIASAIGKRCNKRHRHGQLIGWTAQPAEAYTR